MVTLDLEKHIYFNDEKPNLKYTSVTTLLGKYHKQFDENFHAQRVADREGKTKEEIIEKWREINRQANEYGSYVHLIIERFLTAPKNMYSPRDDFEKTVIASFKNCCFLESLTLVGSYYVKPEYIMSLDFNDKNGLAGTSDIIEDVGDNRFNVWDLKTNKRFNYENNYNEFFNFPVSHLNHSQYNTYTLQISIYALMYERETGKKFNRGGLFYWDKVMETFKLIPVGYMKKEAELVIEHYRNNI